LLTVLPLSGLPVQLEINSAVFIAGMGVRHISVGGTLARVAMHAFIKSATEIAKDGKFDSFAGIVSNAELNKFFGAGP